MNGSRPWRAPLRLTAVAAVAGIAAASFGGAAMATTEPAEPAGSGPAAATDCDPDAVLTWGYGDQIRHWDPHSSSAGQDQWYLMTVYDRLFGQSPEGETLPQLVTEWEYSEDALTLTLHLREGVVFHDGTPLTADIVVQNLDRARGTMDDDTFTSAFKADLAPITAVAAADELTVEITTSEPDVALPNILSDRPGMMMLPSTFDGTGQTNPIGTGPFQLDEWTEGEGGEAVLSKFADYWDAGNIQLAGLVLKDIRDPAARVNALLSGEIDGARVEPADVEAVEADTDLTVETGDTVEVLWFNFDVGTTPELEDPAVREAMSLAIDRQALVDALAFGYGTPTETMLPPFYWASAGVEAVYDPDAAREALEAAGVSGFSMPLLATSNQGLTASVGQAVAGMLAEVGITLEFEVAGEDLAERLYFNRDGGGVIGPWSGRPDPAQTIANIDGPGFVNIAKTEVPEINELLAAANAATDPDERAELFHQIDELSAQNHTSGIALFSPTTVFAHSSTVSGLPIYVQGKHEFRDACVAPS